MLYRHHVLQRGISYNVVFIESQAFTRRLHQLAGRAGGTPEQRRNLRLMVAELKRL